MALGYSKPLSDSRGGRFLTLEEAFAVNRDTHSTSAEYVEMGLRLLRNEWDRGAGLSADCGPSCSSDDRC